VGAESVPRVRVEKARLTGGYGWYSLTTRGVRDRLERIWWRRGTARNMSVKAVAFSGGKFTQDFCSSITSETHDMYLRSFSRGRSMYWLKSWNACKRSFANRTRFSGRTGGNSTKLSAGQLPPLEFSRIGTHEHPRETWLQKIVGTEREGSVVPPRAVLSLSRFTTWEVGYELPGLVTAPPGLVT